MIILPPQLNSLLLFGKYLQKCIPTKKKKKVALENPERPVKKWGIDLF